MAGPDHTDRNAPREVDDPIAELSEIMKFDLSADRSTGADTGIDLESELMGEFMRTNGAAPAEAAAEPSPTEPEPVAGSEPHGPAVPPDLESQLQALLAELDGGSARQAEPEEPGAGDLELNLEPEQPSAPEAHEPVAASWEESQQYDAPEAVASDPEEEFNDELSRVIADLTMATRAPVSPPQQEFQALHEEPLYEEPVQAEPLREEMAQESGDAAFELAEPDFLEIETSELPDHIEPVADDLDIPEIEPEPQVAATLDDEFVNSFNDLESFDPEADEVGASRNTRVEAYSAGHYAEEHFAAAAATPAAAEYSPASEPLELEEYRDEYRDPYADADFDGAYLPEEEPAAGGGRRYGLIAAAAVATLAIAGGIGYFAFSGGDAADGPAIVQADPDPVKVKPEDPGGQMAPNEDKAVYERVADLGEVETPRQQTLIDSEEEPIDIDAVTAPPRVVLPDTSQPFPAGQGTAAETAAAPQVRKSEDRVLPEETAEPGMAEEFVAVEPRRVRTLIVRPDGTLVPREEPVAAAPDLRTGTGSEAVVARPPLPTTETNLLTGTGQPVQPDGQAAVAATPTPEPSAAGSAPAVPVPAPRTEAAPQQPAPAQQSPAAAPPAQPTQVASAPAQPASAQPTAAGASNVEYWVQVSSQPSRELAQASYTDIARRFGNLVAGRAVNIYPAQIEGKGTFYRVRVAGGSRAEANALCERLKAAGAGCFVSR